MSDTRTKIEGVTVVSKPTAKSLTDRQIIDYRNHKERLIKWSLNLGKNPKRAEGYSTETVKRRAYRIDDYFRWIWGNEEGYTTAVTHEITDKYMRELAYGNKSDTHKANSQKALKMYWKWRSDELGEEVWEPQMTFSTNSGRSQPRDFLSRDEREQIREAALEYGSVPNYKSLDPQQRDRWKAHLAQRFEKPKEEITPAEFERANGFKIPSLVWVSLDAGLRPIEVERASVEWVDVDNAVLRIPEEDSSKNDENWIVSLQDRTAEILSKWIQERQQYTKYRSSKELWLTREGNPYQSQSLRHILTRLFEIANIDTENRQVSWYSIRHSVGTYMTHEGDLAAAQAQLRHKSAETTMKYDQTPVEHRRDVLDELG